MAIDSGEKTYMAHDAQEIDDAVDAVATKASAADLTAEVTAREKLQAAVTGLVNGGSKNRLHIDAAGAGTANGLTFTCNSDGSVTVSGSKTNPANVSYAYLRYNNASVTVDAFCDGKHVLSGCPAGGGSSTFRLYVAKGSYVAYDDGQGALLTATAETGIQIIIAIVAGYDLTEPITFKPMVCSSADWNLSQEFEAYCPTLQELYEMILEMGGSRSVQSEPQRMAVDFFDDEEEETR